MLVLLCLLFNYPCRAVKSLVFSYGDARRVLSWNLGIGAFAYKIFICLCSIMNIYVSTPMLYFSFTLVLFVVLFACYHIVSHTLRDLITTFEDWKVGWVCTSYWFHVPKNGPASHDKLDCGQWLIIG